MVMSDGIGKDIGFFAPAFCILLTAKDNRFRAVYLVDVYIDVILDKICLNHARNDGFMPSFQ